MTLSQFGHALRPRHARNATGGARANATTKRAQSGQNNRSLHDLQGGGGGWGPVPLKENDDLGTPEMISCSASETEPDGITGRERGCCRVPGLPLARTTGELQSDRCLYTCAKAREQRNVGVAPRCSRARWCCRRPIARPLDAAVPRRRTQHISSEEQPCLSAVGRW